MNIAQAAELLEIKPNEISLEFAKNQYRRLAKQYHPDNCDTGNATHFIKINAALEVIKRHFDTSLEYQDEQQLFAELKVRLEEVGDAFNIATTDLDSYKNESLELVVQQIIDTLGSYSSSSSLRDQFPNQFRIIIDNHVKRLVGKFDSSILNLSQEYDSWLQGFLRTSYLNLKDEEFKNWFKSSVFYKHIIPACIASISICVLTYAYQFPPSLYLFPIFSFAFSFKKYILSVEDAYSLDNVIIKLNSNELQLNIEDLDVSVEYRTGQDETQGMGGVAGAVVGSRAGLPGAVTGFLIGSLFGSLFGEPIDKLRKRTLSNVSTKLYQIDEQIAQAFNTQLPEIRTALFSIISENYFRNKKNAALLLSYDGDIGVAQSTESKNVSYPTPKLKLVEMLFAFSGAILMLFLVGKWFSR